MPIIRSSGIAALSSTPYRQLENQPPKTTGGNKLYNILELLVSILFPHINDDARSKSLQISTCGHYVQKYFDTMGKYFHIKDNSKMMAHDDAEYI
jgi:hypothetical protein